jgi:hypothetical protein
MSLDGTRYTVFGLGFAFILVTAVLLARHFWILGYFPSPSGHVQASGESGECGECHDAVGDLHQRGPHRALSCEECHGDGDGHVRDGEKIGDMPRSRNISRLCSRCHRELNAGRKTAPLINLEAHVVEAGALFSDRVCLDCHRSHDPRP